MGKKSLIKSTTKKKTASPKKSASKQSAPSAKTAKPAEKKAAKTKKPSSSAAPPKQSRKKLSVSELLKLSFETWAPDKLYAPPADASDTANYTAPPFFEGTPEETERSKALLTLQFDLTVPPATTKAPATAADEIPATQPDKGIEATDEVTDAAAGETPVVAQDAAPDDTAIADTAAPEPSSPPPAPEPAPEPPRKAVPVSELLKLSFGTWSPDKLYAPPADVAGAANYTAPPFFDETSEKAKTVKALLARQFDLNAPPEAPEAPADEAKLPVEEIITAPEIPPAKATTVTGEEPAPAETGAPAKSEAIPEPKAPVEAPATSETEPYVPSSPVCAKPPADREPPNNALRMLIGCLAVIFGILLVASVLNSSKYYLQPTAAGLEIWRGKFSPSGKTLVVTVPDAELSIPIASIYTREDAMTVVYDYYMQEAAKRSTVIGEPDFKAITALYEKAKKYAPTAAQAGLADARLKTITAQSLIIAADEAIVEITPQNIDKALELLDEAASLATDRTQQQLIRVKIDELKAMKAGKAEKETGATPAAP
jgi:hypothetical protein